VVTLINFQICGRRTALASIQLTTKSGARVYRTKAYDRNDLKQHQIDMRVAVEQIVIDDGIEPWRRRLHACIQATGGHFEYPQ